MLLRWFQIFSPKQFVPVIPRWGIQKMKKRVGRLELSMFGDHSTITIKKHYNESVTKAIELYDDDIYDLEHIVKIIMRDVKRREK